MPKTTATKTMKYFGFTIDKKLVKKLFDYGSVSKPKTMKDLAEELIKKHEGLGMSCDLCVIQFVQDLLTIISECVGEMEWCDLKKLEPEKCLMEKCNTYRSCPVYGANKLRKQFNSKLTERSGL